MLTPNLGSSAARDLSTSASAIVGCLASLTLAINSTTSAAGSRSWRAHAERYSANCLRRSFGSLSGSGGLFAAAAAAEGVLIGVGGIGIGSRGDVSRGGVGGDNV